MHCLYEDVFFSYWVNGEHYASKVSINHFLHYNCHLHIMRYPFLVSVIYSSGIEKACPAFLHCIRHIFFPYIEECILLPCERSCKHVFCSGRAPYRKHLST